MQFRAAIVVLFFSMTVFGQGLPDQDKLVQEMTSGDTKAGAKGFIESFGMGGVRSMINALGDMPVEKRMAYGRALLYMDLFRFRNDLNANLQKAEDSNSKALYLNMMATFGGQIHDEVFTPFMNNESNPTFVRLAAAAGIVQLQKPDNYEKFYEIAERAVIDPATGQNDFRYVHIEKSNLGLFLYTKSKIDDRRAPHGKVVTAIELAGAGDTEIYQIILDNRMKKYIPHMIDRAIRAGAPDLLRVMLDHKTCKRNKSEISRAIPAAEAVAQFNDKLLKANRDPNHPVIGPAIPVRGEGQGTAEGFRAGYAVVKIDAEGNMEVVCLEKPASGATENIKELYSGNTLPAYSDWKPIESYILVTAP